MTDLGDTSQRYLTLAHPGIVRWGQDVQGEDSRALLFLPARLLSAAERKVSRTPLSQQAPCIWSLIIIREFFMRFADVVCDVLRCQAIGL
jgi:hypothetical protein